MKRREFIAVLGGAAAAWPFAARAQQAVRRLGVLMLNPAGDPVGETRVAVLQQALDKLGWSVGKNLQIDYRWGAFEPEPAREAIAQLLHLNPDLILANSVDATRAAQQATRAVPIVFNAVSAPVELGFVSSLSHPGGNITGFTNLEPSIGSKWLELLKEISPQIKHVEFLFNPDATPAAPLFYRSIREAAIRLAVQSAMAPVRQSAEIDAVITKAANESAGALIVQADTFLASNPYRSLIIDSAVRYRLPAIYPFDYFAAGGGLMSYGPDVTEEFRQSATYIDRILKGEKPSDLPVQQPTKFKLVVNLKTAHALAISVPQDLTVAADEVIE
jgi:putative ABC transport system substrate-binding protein